MKSFGDLIKDPSFLLRVIAIILLVITCILMIDFAFGSYHLYNILSVAVYVNILILLVLVIMLVTDHSDEICEMLFLGAGGGMALLAGIWLMILSLDKRVTGAKGSCTISFIMIIITGALMIVDAVLTYKK